MMPSGSVVIRASIFDSISEPGVKLGGIQFVGKAYLLRNIFGDKEKADGFSGSVPAGSKHHARRESLAIFPYSDESPFPLSVGERLLKYRAWCTGIDVFGRVQDR